jgi:hypothetical protein
MDVMDTLLLGKSAALLMLILPLTIWSIDGLLALR